MRRGLTTTQLTGHRTLFVLVWTNLVVMLVAALSRYAFGGSICSNINMYVILRVWDKTHVYYV
jgi:hypothetical protein